MKVIGVVYYTKYTNSSKVEEMLEEKQFIGEIEKIMGLSVDYFIPECFLN